MALVEWGVTPIAAQMLPPQVQDLLSPRGGQSRGSGMSGLGGQRDNSENGSVLLQPAGAGKPLPRSMLERILSDRAGTPLSQFGYSDVGSGRSVVLPQMGGVQENYILGPGDEVIISLRGQEAGEYRTFVDRSGRLILPKLNPINVAGRTFGEFRNDLGAAVQRAYVATEAFASLGSVRQIRVTVGGEVNNPGLRVMTGLASAFDALLVSNGVKKTGSLRNIHILRGGRRINVDLYGVLRGTGSAQIPLLTDGDRVIVNPLGATVAITGPVRVPAIYELAPGQPGMTAANLIALAGGFSVRGRYDLVLIGLGTDGRTEMSSLPNDRALVRDSDVLIVRNTADQTVGRATLQAGTANAFSGTYAAQATRLSTMLRAPGVLGDDPYPLFAIISRRDPVSLLRTLIAVTPSAVMAGRQDFSLQTDDVIHTFTRTEANELVRAINWFDEQRRRQDEKLQTPGQTPLLGRPDDLEPRRPRRPANAGMANGAASRMSSSEAGFDDLQSSETMNPGDNASSTIALDNVNRYDNGTGYSTGYGYTYDEGYDYGTGYDDDSDVVGLGSSSNGEAGTSRLTGDAEADAQMVSQETARQYEEDIANLQTAQGTPGATGANRRRRSRPDPTLRYRRELARVQRLADALKAEPAIVANFLQDHMVTVSGAIRGPGNFLVGPDLPLSTLVQAAGGTVNWSDKTGVERVSTVIESGTGMARTATQTMDINQSQFATAIVRPRDQYRFPEASVQLAGTITLKGEVRRPGIYNIVRGERLSDLLVRAGGLTQVAYPYGAIFLRKSVAAREREGFQRAARELESQLTVNMTRTSTSASASNPAATYPAIRALVRDLRNQQALGRISVVADPAVLATRPQVDPLLEAGDILVVPQRPSTVTVLGEVMQSASFPSEAKLSVNDYINRAGGYSSLANASLTFVILPDGTARQMEKSWFAKDDSIPPGSVIVVPKDVDPINLRQILLDGAQILSQLAVGAASLAILSSN